MTLVDIHHARRKSVAGADFRAIAGDQHRADLADAIGTIGGGPKGGLHIRAAQWRRLTGDSVGRQLNLLEIVGRGIRSG
jgi:hypothetical protein